MLASELFAKDRWGAFKNYITIEESKRSNLLPQQYHNYFPNKCECDSEIIISTDMVETPDGIFVKTIGARVMCCDPRCRIKLGYNLHHIFEAFSCKNIGEKTCLKIMEYAYDNLELKSHVEAFYVNDMYLFPDVKGMAFVHFIQAITKVKNSGLTFPDMVSKLGIPGFDKNAVKVLDGINGIVELIEVIKLNGGIEAFLNNRGIQDPLKIFYFNEFLPDILHAQHKVFRNILPLGQIKLKVVLSRRLTVNGVFVSSGQFIDICNRVGEVGNTRLFDIEENSAIGTTNFLVSNYREGSTKIKAALNREYDEGELITDSEGNSQRIARKIIYTPEEFIVWLKEVVDKCGIKTEEPPKETVTMELL